MEAGLRAAVPLGPVRSSDSDVLLGIRHLVDIALATLGPARNDATIAYEAVLHIGAVLREVLLRGVPPAIIEGSEGRRLLRPAELTHREHVEVAFNPLREAAAGSPTVAISLLETLGMLRRAMEAAGLTDRLPFLRTQAERVVGGYEATKPLPADLDRVVEAAREQGFRVEAPPAAAGHD